MAWASHATGNFKCGGPEALPNVIRSRGTCNDSCMCPNRRMNDVIFAFSFFQLDFAGGKDCFLFFAFGIFKKIRNAWTLTNFIDGAWVGLGQDLVAIFSVQNFEIHVKREHVAVELVLELGLQKHDLKRMF